MCYTLLPDDRELVLVNLAHCNSYPINIIGLGDFCFKAFVGWDRCSTDARIGFLAQNSKDEVRLFWILWSYPFLKTRYDDIQFLRIEMEDMKFEKDLVKQIQVIKKAHFIGQSSLVERYWDTYCLIIQTDNQIFLNMKDGFHEALLIEGTMHDLLMHVGFNNTVYCVHGTENNTNTQVVEFLI